MIRKIVHINEDLCDGCGQCLPNCEEGALQIIDGKAKLLKDAYCDGLGACLGHCPQGAISIIEREAHTFDENAVQRHLADKKNQEYNLQSAPTSEIRHPDTISEESALTHWPVKLNLVPLEAPFFNECELLVLADCVPVANPHVHPALISGRSVVIGCPKFDNVERYVDKLGEILKRNTVKSLLVTHMEVPCCSGLQWIVKQAVAASGKQIPIKHHVITVKGGIR